MIRHLLPLMLALLTVAQGIAQVSVRNDLVQLHEVLPEEVAEGVLTIENVGNSEALVRIYQTDYLFQADGSIDYGQAGTAVRSNADWIELEQIQVVIPGGSLAEVSYRVDVPNAQLNGSYWSMIMIEEVVPTGDRTEGVAVNTVIRYGVQVVTEFGNGQALLEFMNPSLDDIGDDGFLLQVDVANSGEQMVRAEYYVELYDVNGTQVARAEGEPRRTYPGTSIRQQFPLGELSAGAYTALVIADSGGDELFGAQYQLEVSEPD